jgi:hypothetical protein
VTEQNFLLPFLYIYRIIKHRRCSDDAFTNKHDSHLAFKNDGGGHNDGACVHAGAFYEYDDVPCGSFVRRDNGCVFLFQIDAYHGGSFHHCRMIVQFDDGGIYRRRPAARMLPLR